MHFVVSVFTSRPTSNRASLFLVYVFTQCIIVSIDQELMCSIQFESVVIFRNYMMVYFKAKLKNSGDKASPCFRQFWTGNASDIFMYADFATGFV